MTEENKLDNEKHTGSDNVLVGLGAGRRLTSGCNNVCIGVDSGSSITTESRCVCIGDGTDIVVGKGDGQVIIHEPVTLALGATTILSERLFSRGLFPEKNKRKASLQWINWAANRLGWTKDKCK